MKSKSNIIQDVKDVKGSKSMTLEAVRNASTREEQ